MQNTLGNMRSDRKGGHSLYDLKVHVVWITKYRKPVLSGAVGQGLCDIIQRICEEQEIATGILGRAGILQ